MAKLEEHSSALAPSEPIPESNRAHLGSDIESIKKSNSIAQKYPRTKNSTSRRMEQDPSKSIAKFGRICSRRLNALKKSKGLNTKNEIICHED